MIKLDKKWFLNSDAHSFTIGYMKPGKDGEGNEKEIYHAEYNYGTLAGALQGYVKIKGRDAIRKEVVTTLDALLELLSKIDSHCETIAKRIKDAK